MSLVALCSAHGSPGATTAALVLGAAWPAERGRVLVVEADSCGGVVAARFGLGDTPGLASLTAAARSGVSAEIVLDHVQRLPGGLAVIVGPPSAEQASTLLPDATSLLVEVASEVDVVVDCGRVLPSSPVVGLLRQAEVVLMVVRPSADQLRPAATRVEALQRTGVNVAVCLVGDTPYGPVEVEAALGVDVAGVLAWDSRSADALTGVEAPRRGLRHMPLARSAASLADGIATRLSAPPSAAGNGLVREVAR